MQLTDDPILASHQLDELLVHGIVQAKAIDPQDLVANLPGGKCL